jgi:hypothetical protein
VLCDLFEEQAKEYNYVFEKSFNKLLKIIDLDGNRKLIISHERVRELKENRGSEEIFIPRSEKEIWKINVKHQEDQLRQLKKFVPYR